MSTTATMSNYQATLGLQTSPTVRYQVSAPPVLTREEIIFRSPANQLAASTLPVLCDGCHRFVIPNEKHTVGGCAVLSAVGLCFVQPLLAMIPLCCNTFKDLMYVCPNCRTKINLIKKNRWL